MLRLDLGIEFASEVILSTLGDSTVMIGKRERSTSGEEKSVEGERDCSKEREVSGEGQRVWGFKVVGSGRGRFRCAGPRPSS